MSKKKHTLETPIFPFEEGYVEEGLKTCAYCGKSKRLSDFNRGTTLNSKMHVCKPCHRKRGADVNKLKKYIQPPGPDYKCPITGKTKDQIRGESWVLDHDHKTGQFRGWLSHGANVALGYLNDDYDACIKAAEYLLEHRIKNDES